MRGTRTQAAGPAAGLAVAGVLLALGLAGFSAAVERQSQSAEVLLRVTTESRSQAMRTIQAPGQPTLYGIDLAGGRVLNVYLDPGTVGLNALHGTFFDSQGRELEIARAPEITARQLGGPPSKLPVLQEGPGHFFSDVELGPGEWQLEIVATTRTGDVLRARLTKHL